MTISVNLHSDSVVNERTGVVDTPSEYVQNLRDLEVSVQRLDDDIVGLKADLKQAREAREKAIAQLRSAIREGKVLPLLETDDDGAEENEGDQADA